MIASRDHRLATPHEPASYVQMLVIAMKRWKDRLAFDQPCGRSYTYAQSADLVARIAAAYRTLGLGDGAGVGVYSTNSAEAWMAGFAAQVNRGYYAALPARGGPDDLAYIAEDADLAAIVIHPDLAEHGARLMARCPSIRHILTLGPCGYGIDLLRLAEDGGTARALTGAGCRSDDVALLWYSGGTTGYPKGAVHTQSSILENAMRLMVGYEIPMYDMRYLACAPISHSGYPWIAPTLVSGGTVVLQKVFEAEEFLNLVAAKKITLSSGVPTMIYALQEAARHRDIDLSSLRRFVYGGSPISPDKLGEAQASFGNVFTQMYGQAESLGAGTALLSAEHEPGRPDRLASCGRPAPGVEVTLLDEELNEVAPGAVGEICLRTRSTMREYWKRPDMTEEVFAGGWLHTGDLGTVDEDGFYTIVDRKKDMIISGGFNVFPAEVERILAASCDVYQVAVIGVPDPKWGEAVKALIVPRPGRTVDVAALMAEVRKQKGAVHTPKTIDIVASLALTPAGKVDKKLMRAEFWKDAKRHVG